LKTTRLHKINTTLFLFLQKENLACAKRKTKKCFYSSQCFTEGKKVVGKPFVGMKVLCIFMLMGDYWVMRFSFFLLSFNKAFIFLRDI